MTTLSHTGRHLVVLMGVSGCGKSTIAAEFSKLTNWPMLEGDDYHPSQNIAKMSKGVPLTDADRADWVAAMIEASNTLDSPHIILACSALTPFVRRGLARINRTLHYVHLNTAGVDMMARLSRPGHFMPKSLLDSQYQALSVPDGALDIDASLGPEEVVKILCVHFREQIDRPIVEADQWR